MLKTVILFFNRSLRSLDFKKLKKSSFCGRTRRPPDFPQSGLPSVESKKRFDFKLIRFRFENKKKRRGVSPSPLQCVSYSVDRIGFMNWECLGFISLHIGCHFGTWLTWCIRLCQMMNLS